MKKTLRTIKVLLGMEVALAESTLADGSKIVYDELIPGSPIFLVTPDGNVPLTVGEYPLEDGSTIIVEEDGLIASIKPVETEKPEVEVEAAAEPTNYIPGEETVITKPEETPEIETKVMALEQRLTELEATLFKLVETLDTLVATKMAAEFSKMPTLTSVLDVKLSSNTESLTPEEIAIRNFKKH